MINQQLIDFIKSRLESGLNREQIKNQLMQGGGWTEQDIEEAFINISNSEKDKFKQHSGNSLKRMLLVKRLGILTSLFSFWFGLKEIAIFLITMMSAIMISPIIIIIAAVFFLLGVILFRCSYKFKDDSIKSSKCFILASLFFFAYAIYGAIGIYFEYGFMLIFSSSIPTLMIAGILSVITGLKGFNIQEEVERNTFAEEEHKFYSRVKKISLLILVFLVAYVFFRITEMGSRIGYQETADNLSLDGRIVFMKYDSFEICIIDLSNSKNIDCFDNSKMGRDPYWGPDGKSVYYDKWDSAGDYVSVVYNTVTKTSEITKGENVYENNKSTRQLKRATGHPYNYVLDTIISPNGSKKVYQFVGDIFISDIDGGNEIKLTKSGEQNCDWPLWYSNDSIVVWCSIKNNKVLTNQRSISGLFFANVDDFRLTLITPMDYYFGEVDLYRSR